MQLFRRIVGVVIRRKSYIFQNVILGSRRLAAAQAALQEASVEQPKRQIGQ